MTDTCAGLTDALLSDWLKWERAQAWEEGYRQNRGLVDQATVDLLNPYRRTRDAPDYCNGTDPLPSEVPVTGCGCQGSHTEECDLYY